jgi:GAF domain-containing protein
VPSVEPLPETKAALEQLSRFGSNEIAAELTRISRQVRSLVPELVGLSLGFVQDGLTFTLVADSEVARRLDVIQYVDDGPCLDALRTAEPIATTKTGLLDEGRWAMFARAQEATGVRSTLSMPILDGDEVVAGVNLYASTVGAFDGQHEGIARVCGAWAPGATTNADLSLHSWEEAAATPGRLRDQQLFDQAVGVLAAARGLTTDAASDRLRDAAVRAGVTPSQAAQAVLEVLAAEV